MRELIQFIASSLVDAPDRVQVTEKEEEDTVSIELKVAREDLGKVIGKQGRTARAIRSVLAGAAERAGKRVKLDIVE